MCWRKTKPRRMKIVREIKKTKELGKDKAIEKQDSKRHKKEERTGER
jgi:hypothetical protein